jgi:hypothetical protein
VPVYPGWSALAERTILFVPSPAPPSCSPPRNKVGDLAAARAALAADVKVIPTTTPVCFIRDSPYKIYRCLARNASNVHALGSTRGNLPPRPARRGRAARGPRVRPERRRGGASRIHRPYLVGHLPELPALFVLKICFKDLF